MNDYIKHPLLNRAERRALKFKKSGTQRIIGRAVSGRGPGKPGSGGVGKELLRRTLVSGTKDDTLK